MAPALHMRSYFPTRVFASAPGVMAFADLTLVLL